MDSLPSGPIYEQVDSLHFEITGEYFGAFRQWAAAIDQRVYQEQLEGRFMPVGEYTDPSSIAWVQEICQHNARANGRAYYGAVGGGYRFIFDPSQIGTGIEVENILTGERINLTRDANW